MSVCVFFFIHAFGGVRITNRYGLVDELWNEGVIYSAMSCEVESEAGSEGTGTKKREE